MSVRNFILPFVALLIASTGRTEELAGAQRVEVALNERLLMARFGGGENVSVALVRNDRDTFTIAVSYSEGDTTSYTINRKGRLVPEPARPEVHPKQNGVAVGSFAKAYLAYDAGSGVKVYFCDGAIASPNRYLFLVTKGTQSPARAPAVALGNGNAPEQIVPRLSDLATAQRVEVKAAEPLVLTAFGGGNVAIFMQRNDRDSFTLVKDWEVSRNRTPQVWVPTPSGLPATYPKQFGLSAGSFSKAYLVHGDPNGLRVYFCDSMDVSQNHYLYLVVPAKSDAAARRAASVPGGSESRGTASVNPGSHPALPMNRDSASPATVPAWSVIGGTLLYDGRELTQSLDAEAVRWGLSREDFVEERVWIAKQLKYGPGHEAEYEEQLSERQQRRTPAVRAAVLELRRAKLPAAKSG